MNQLSIEDYIRKELMQGIILKIAKWLIQYVDGYHVAKNGGGRKKATE